ncbi:MAG TPA: cytochrome b/b6 domain-containing protein [Acidimicrobiales bacterium]
MRPAATTAATATDPGGPVVRNNRATRWYHAATFTVTTLLLVTGWWLRTGHEGRPSVLADIAGRSDADLHRQAGWVSVALAAAGLTLGARAAWTFVRETARVDRGDAGWLRRWPTGAVTGRFGTHTGHFDPGQRLANVAFVATLGTLIVTGVAMTTLSGGPTFATMVRVHRGATYVLTGLVAGHLLIVSGLLPGYRGVWRAMVGARGVPAATARRLWPADAPGGRPDGTRGRGGDRSATDRARSHRHRG